MTHTEINQLLPWYATATLSDEERREVEAHLAECAACSSELETLSVMQRAITDIGETVPAPSPKAFNRALAEIEQFERTRTRTEVHIPAESHGNQAIRSVRKLVVGWWRPAPLMARAVMALEMALVLALGVAVLYQRHQNSTFVTLAHGSCDNHHTCIAVSFSDTATESEIRRAIISVHGSIVEGPSSLGLYTIQLPIPPQNSTEVQDVLHRLRENSAVIRFAEQKE